MLRESDSLVPAGTDRMRHSKTAVDDRWIVNLRPSSQASVRLVCCPYAGAGAHIFWNWARRLPSWIEVLAVELPGRGLRWREPTECRLAPIVSSLAVAMNRWLDRPFALFGHSMGSLVAFELARQLRRDERRGPFRLFVSARAAPHCALGEPSIHGLADGAFLAAIDRYQGWQAEVRQDEELVASLLPMLRADFEVCETYEWHDERPIECAVNAFYGSDDVDVSPDDVRAWADVTSGPFSMTRFSGGHFFLRSRETELLAAITRELRSFEPTVVPTAT